MALNFADELERCGCTLSREDFYDLVQEVKAGFCPSWTEDELACHPVEAQQYCEAVRVRASAPIPYQVIMHALINARKQAAKV